MPWYSGAHAAAAALCSVAVAASLHIATITTIAAIYRSRRNGKCCREAAKHCGGWSTIEHQVDHIAH
jgi:hypothetical protein